MKEDSEFSSSVLAGRYRRIKLFTWLAQFVIAMVIASNHFAGVDVLEVPILVAAFFINFISLGFLYLKRYTLSSAILLLNGAFVLTSLMFLNNGLRDSAVVGLPGILMFAAIVGSSRLFYLIFVYLILFVVGLGFYDLTINLERQVAPLNSSVVVDIVVILLVIGFAIKLLVNELKKTTNKLTYEHRQVQESHLEAKHLAHHDALTGLPNRYLAKDRFQQSLAHVSRNQELVGLLFIDLDHFKPVNDNLGHDIGDTVLKEVAQRISKVVRKKDSICRIGGDEFIVILEACKNQDVIADIASKILIELKAFFHIKTHRVEISASIGVAIAPNDGDDFDELSRKADLAMYKSKALGRNACSFFDEELNQELAIKSNLIKQLREALVNKTLEVNYQPVFNLTDQQIVSVEALLRWRLSESQHIAPEVFIPLAEDNGMIHEMGKRILLEACQQCVRWRKDGFPNLGVSVNVSTHQLRDNSLESYVLEVLKKTGLPPQALTLEIKEIALISQYINAEKQILAIRNFGVNFCIDDYGYGHSNLSDLHKLGITSIKLDRKLTNEIINDPVEQKMLPALLDSMSQLTIDVIAKGILDQRFLDFYQQKKCIYGQGFHMAPPLPLDDFLMLAERAHR